MVVLSIRMGYVVVDTKLDSGAWQMSKRFEVDGASEVIARELDITVNDARSYVTVLPSVGKRGQLLGYIVNFKQSTPEVILTNAGAAADRSVHVRANLFTETEQ